MNRMTVHNRNDLSLFPMKHAGGTIVEDTGIEPVLENHEMKPPPVADCRNHVALEPFARDGNDGGLSFASFWRVAPKISATPVLPRPSIQAFTALRRMSSRAFGGGFR